MIRVRFMRPRLWQNFSCASNCISTRSFDPGQVTKTFLKPLNVRSVTGPFQAQLAHFARQLPSLASSRWITTGTSAEDSPITDVEEGNLIYHGTLTKQIFLTKFCSISSSTVGFAMQPYLYSTFGSAHMAVLVALFSTVGFFTYVTPFLLHFVTKRYVADIHFNREAKVFTVTTFNFFMRPRKMQFRASDVHIPDVPGLFTSMLVKGKPIFFDPKEFQDADALAHLMGFDKPLDLHLGINPDKTKAAEKD